MTFDIKTHLVGLLYTAVQHVIPEHADAQIALERPKQASHGDFSSNIAMQLARLSKRNPRELAQAILAHVPPSAFIDRFEIAGAGFINMHLAASAKLEVIKTTLSKAENFGRSKSGKNKKVQIEFVSANPTGPLHVGHGRGAAYGASLSDLLAFAGWDVTREYYVNDAGRQMDILALSTWLRYLELHGSENTIPFPSNGYQGSYVRDMAMSIKIARGSALVHSQREIMDGIPPLPEASRSDAEAGEMRETHLDALIVRAKALLGADWSAVHNHVLVEQLADCRNDLEEFGVRYEVWFSEKSLFDTGLVERCIDKLEKAGHIYKQDNAKWFRSTAYGDEKDRVVQRDNGLHTYFASDIAYHLNKLERGFDRLINVWGADHHGYIPRVKGALQALGCDPDRLDVALVQFAVLYRLGQKVSMSTRAGEFVSLRALREEVGNDACRFFYILRKSDQHLDFDLDLAKSQTNDNPVYYIQYAHARICSVLAQWGEDRESARELLTADLSVLTNAHELALAAKLDEFPEVVEQAAQDLAPHMIAFYLKDLASAFHSYYNAQKLLVEDDALKNARIALIMAVRQVIRNGMAILGVSCPDSM